MILCICVSLNEKEMHDIIKHGCDNLDDLKKITGAGYKCKACKEFLEIYFKEIMKDKK